MNKIFLIPVVALTFVACDRVDHTQTSTTTERSTDRDANLNRNPNNNNDTNTRTRTTTTERDVSLRDEDADSDNSNSYDRNNSRLNVRERSYNTNRYDADNTGINVRDRSSNTRTSESQLENEGDRTLTQRIRQAIMSDDHLSTKAKNIKVITINGVVTLRGPVMNSEEKNAIERAVRRIQGVSRIDNQLEVTRNNY